MRGVDHQPFGDHDLLLVAARQRADRIVGAAGLDAQAARSSRRSASRSARAVDDAAAATAGRAPRRRGCRAPTSAASALRSCGPRGSAPCRSPALGVGAGWRSRTGLPSISDLAVDAAQHAEQRQQQLALALAVEPAEADHLAAADRERDVVAAGRSSRGPATSSTGVGARARRAACGGKTCAVFAADHQLDDLVVGLGARPRRSRRCGRCGTPCSRRRARRSRACGARCRAAPGPPRAAASAPRRPCRRRRRSAPRSPRRGPWSSRADRSASPAPPMPCAPASSRSFRNCR